MLCKHNRSGCVNLGDQTCMPEYSHRISKIFAHHLPVACHLHVRGRRSLDLSFGTSSIFRLVSQHYFCMTKVTKEVVVVGAGCVFQLLTLSKQASGRLKTEGSVESVGWSRVSRSRRSWPSRTLLYAPFLVLPTYLPPTRRKFQIYEREHEVGGTWRVRSHYYLLIVSRSTNTR